jgi:hypothetical protein
MPHFQSAAVYSIIVLRYYERLKVGLDGVQTRAHANTVVLRHSRASNANALHHLAV